MNFILYGILGAAAGVLSGLFGLGGGAIVIPALVFLFGMGQHEAQGTSLAMLLPPIGLLAAWRYWKSGYVDIGVAAILALTFVVGAAVGAHYAVKISQVHMARLFGGALVAIGVLMIVTGK
jgi:uncharacterized membrane protein YfcA